MAPDQAAGGDGEVIRLERVHKHYGSFVAVEEADFGIGSGEFFAMLGPSGSGKTTCLRLIAGFEQPTAGHIELFGETAEGVPPYRRNVNTVFQDYALFPHMTVAQNIQFGLFRWPLAWRRTRLAEMLQLVGLEDMARRYPHELSGGQQQRLGLVDERSCQRHALALAA